MRGQYFFKNMPLKPSRPGALSKGIILTMLLISSFEKGATKLSRFIVAVIREGRSKSI
jgi:hypothetical protein